MQDAIFSVLIFHTLAALGLFAIAAIHSLRAARKTGSHSWVIDPAAVHLQLRADRTTQDFAEEYDLAA